MNKDWPYCGRIVYLSGGVLATNEPLSDVITLWPKTIDGKVCEITIETFDKLYYALKKCSLLIVGVDFITNPLEATGKAPMQFRGYVEQDTIWPNWDAMDKWASLSLSAFHNKNGLAYDISNRINFQLNSINNRLRNLCLAYHNQLNALALKNSFKNGQRFQDGFTDLVYQEFHSFLFDAGILRDYLCEYVYNYSGKGSLKERIREIRKNYKYEITSASRLFKSLKEIEKQSELESYFEIEMSEGGWLYELGQYRDLVMHSAPINLANFPLYAIQEYLVLPDSKEMVSVRFPLPDNPSELYSDRSKRNHFDKYIEQFSELRQNSLNSHGKYDCLEYAHIVFGLLSNLSLDVAKESPFKPMRQTYFLTDSGTISVPEYIDES